ncbi:TetR/AcrR family transcriptional regulator [Tsukamurella pulmonis]|uniref:Regulatory protein, tetR family n=1 Tax=Tsukamurella pulmonis TaxID=47312 RepID=A0A1H1HRU0_9ACTN|nr:TetR family transcriptional regulator [Tsukamurella pulmonis]RDH09751.1 TetR/AcrR family transcriptional regulator [Tsukamurella pulmonis]SDR27756.1 regulatory protein, tetR family [Tsukamurella pulmonis]
MSEEPSATAQRIRDAAVSRFGTDGFGVGLRAIAADAGVTAGLIIHHFGSKDGLRRACDEYIRNQLWSHKRAQADASAFTGFGAEEIAELTPALRYMMRSFQAGGDFARSMMDRLVEDTEGYIDQGVASGMFKPSRTPASRARFLTYQAVGGMLVWHLLHTDPARPDFAAELSAYMEALTPGALELFANGLMVDRTMLDEYLLYVPDPPEDDVPA